MLGSQTVGAGKTSPVRVVAESYGYAHVFVFGVAEGAEQALLAFQGLAHYFADVH